MYFQGWSQRRHKHEGSTIPCTVQMMVRLTCIIDMAPEVYSVDKMHNNLAHDCKISLWYNYYV